MLGHGRDPDAVQTVDLSFFLCSMSERLIESIFVSVWSNCSLPSKLAAISSAFRKFVLRLMFHLRTAKTTRNPVGNNRIGTAREGSVLLQSSRRKILRRTAGTRLCPPRI